MKEKSKFEFKDYFITKEAILDSVNKKNQFNVSPTYVGSYRLGGSTGLSIFLVKKPRWIHRKLMAICLGWEWIDNK